MAEFSKELRVAHLVLSLDVGGAEKLVVNLANYAIKDAGYTVDVLCLDNIGELAEQLESQANVLLLSRPPGPPNFKVAKKIAHHLKSNNYQVLHAHNVEALMYATLAKAIYSGFNIVYTQHGIPDAMGKMKHLLFKLACHRCSSVIAVSESVHTYLSNDLYINKVSTILNGVDVKRYESVAPKFKGPTLKLVTVARLEEVKAIDTFIKALKQIDGIIPFEYVLVGDGSERDSLEKMVLDLKLTESVRFVGSQQNVTQYLAEANYFVLPSWSEGVSIALLEAMACGLVPLVSAVGGNVKLVREQLNGFIFTAGDSDQIVKALGEAATSMTPEKYTEMSQENRRIVEAEYSLTATEKQYRSCYEAN